MFTVELYAGIRRAVMVEGLSRREAAKRFGVHRNTITKMLQYPVPPVEENTGRVRSECRGIPAPAETPAQSVKAAAPVLAVALTNALCFRPVWPENAI